LVSLYLNLGDGTKSITASELSSQLRITPAGVTHLTNPLEEAGYIERRQNSNDRRVILIGLTNNGKEFARTILTETHERLTGLVQYLGEEDSRMIVRLLSSTMAYLEALPEK
jgi:DNA-binding MarR family transcriptional regulator